MRDDLNVPTFRTVISLVMQKLDIVPTGELIKEPSLFNAVSFSTRKQKKTGVRKNERYDSKCPVCIHQGTE